MRTTRGGEGTGLIIDPFAGISGDMFLGALVDLGLEAGWLVELVESLGLGAGVTVERADRSGIDCGRVRFHLPPEPGHRHLDDVLEVIAASPTPRAVRERAETVFRRLAEAEASVHGVPVEEVHFHEVGALDSILDVLCTVAAVDALSYHSFATRPVAVGTGTVEIDHGRYPLPAPATARLLEGLPVRETTYSEECTTPTGAALIAVLTSGRRAPREAVYGRSGFGAGTRNPEGRPNCLRLIEYRAEGPEAEPGAMHVVQTDIDDMAPEYVSAARDEIVAAGAADVTLVRIDMKKGRSGVRLEALVEEPALDGVVEAMFRATTTIGVRHWPVLRATLARTEDVVEWRGHEIRVKQVTLPDGSTRRKPEFDDVLAAAKGTGHTAREVREALNAVERQKRSD